MDWMNNNIILMPIQVHVLIKQFDLFFINGSATSKPRRMTDNSLRES